MIYFAYNKVLISDEVVTKTLDDYIKISDASDKPHVISAYLAGCDAIISYDSHFQEATDFITALTPEEFLAHIETSV